MTLRLKALPSFTHAQKQTLYILPTDDRLRIPVESSYTEALGLVIYAFARLEWDAIWCCERLRPNYVRTVDRKTAGEIAKDLKEYTQTIADEALRADCTSGAVELAQLIGLRNAIVHGKPGPGRDQRLFRDGHPFSIEDLDKAADAFTACSLHLNRLLHGPLKLLSEAPKA